MLKYKVERAPAPVWMRYIDPDHCHSCNISHYLAYHSRCRSESIYSLLSLPDFPSGRVKSSAIEVLGEIHSAAADWCSRRICFQ